MVWKTSYCSLVYIYSGAISKLSNLIHLDVSYNRELGLCGFSNITHDLPFTQIRTLRANYLHCDAGPSVTLLCEDIQPLINTSLEELYFDGNNIDFAQTGVPYYLPASLKSLTLNSNRWIQNRYTYCNILGLTNLTHLDISDMNQHQISSDEQYVFCQNLFRIINCEKLRSSSFEKTSNPRVPESCIKGCLTPGRAILVITILYRHRWKLRYWYYIAKRHYFQGYNGHPREKRYRFDAFISYADEERVFVTKNVQAKLEEEACLRLCIHHRDFIPGCDIADNIINAIHQSRKVVFIITEAFLKSEWCIYEIHMAHIENVMSRQGTNMLILVFKEEIPRYRIPKKYYKLYKRKFT
ncbi:Toll-like receptor 4 [Mytilus coruscus]|uniref:Toll-like receptor 4 n=1 Tax=Mytilus coruscus TaxID=42192 RepID=A0A6J8BCX7_MYTCO|nr:Toll-like receptor 4 [Mytilus coruscus]